MLQPEHQTFNFMDSLNGQTLLSTMCGPLATLMLLSICQGTEKLLKEMGDDDHLLKVARYPTIGDCIGLLLIVAIHAWTISTYFNGELLLIG